MRVAMRKKDAADPPQPIPYHLVEMKPLPVLIGILSSLHPHGSLPATCAAPVAGSASHAVLRVAAVQMRSGSDLAGNVAVIKKHLAECAARQVQVVAFPECAVASYSPKDILKLSAGQLAAAAEEIAGACGSHRIAALVGTPEHRDGRWRNCVLIIDASGNIVGRYYKAHLVGGDRAWNCVPGADVPPVFAAGATLASVIICHDSRYPELCRLPVIAGARVVFYLSHESALVDETKIGPYRAQVQARAVENGVFVVHANAPADDLRRGSHGQSRVVAPDGNIMQEASQLQEEILVADLQLAQATGATALKSLEGPLGDWWRAALDRVRYIGAAAPRPPIK